MTDKPKALIYCRVSSARQKREGSGLESQEHRCRKYATERGYKIEAVFPDDITGGGDFMNRPGMVALLAYLDAHPEEQYIVIFDDLKRYARDVEFHLKLRREMERRNATRECLNFRFEDSPEGKFLETLIAAHAELERGQNRRQVIQKMTARLEKGKAVFPVARGYRWAPGKEHGGRILVRDEPVASIITEALEGFAFGRFQTQAEVRRFLEAHPDFPKPKSGRIAKSLIKDMLQRVLYAGYIDYNKWGISIRKGIHEPLISFETYQRIQERLNTKALAPARTNLAKEFPLRGFVECDDCGSALTSCSSKGRNRYYPYYLCCNKECDSYGKSIPRDRLEGEFSDLLATVRPSPALFEIASAMFRDIWDQRVALAKNLATSLRREIDAADKRISDLIDRVVDTDNATLVSAYETKIKALEMEKMRLTERLSEPTRKPTTFDDQFRTAMKFLSNPCIFWDSGRIELQRAVLKMVFSQRLRYARNGGFRTDNMEELSLPFKLLHAPKGQSFAKRYSMVGPAGLEPATKPL